MLHAGCVRVAHDCPTRYRLNGQRGSHQSCTSFPPPCLPSQYLLHYLSQNLYSPRLFQFGQNTLRAGRQSKTASSSQPKRALQQQSHMHLRP